MQNFATYSLKPFLRPVEPQPLGKRQMVSGGQTEELREHNMRAELEERNKQLAAEVERNKQLAVEVERNKQLAAEVERNKQLAAEVERNKQLASEVERNKQLAAEVEHNKQLAVEACPRPPSVPRSIARLLSCLFRRAGSIGRGHAFQTPQ